MFNLYALIGAAVLSLSLLTGTYFKGRADMYDTEESKITKMQDDARDAVEAERDKSAKRLTALAESYEVKKADAKIIYRNIVHDVDKIVERPIYRDGVCVDMDGLVLINAALAGVAVAAPNPGQPRSILPEAHTPE